MPQINWYPGHMAKSRRLLQEQLRAVDAVIELCDARAPQATRNPDLEKLTKDNLQQFFPEIDHYFAQCRFTDCRHIKEPGCVVREAVEKGEIARSRYESYCAFYKEAEKIKDWEVKAKR